MSDIQNVASYDAKGGSITMGFGTQTSSSGAGFGKDSGNASSTTKAGVTGVAGNKDARSTDAETGIAKIFDEYRVTQEINAQIAITKAFSQEAPKAAAGFAENQADTLRKQADAASPEERKSLLEEAAKWDEGGTYRIAMHTVIGGLAGGISGALGAGISASAAPTLNELQSQITQGLTNQGVNSQVANALSQLLTQATTLGIGAAVGGTNAAAMAFNIDANNRQLHTIEIDWIKKNAKRYAQQQGISEADAERALSQQAYRQVQFGVEGAWDSNANNFLRQAGNQMLPTDPNFVNSGPGYMFYATPEQKVNASMYLSSLITNADFYKQQNLKQPTVDQIVNAATKDGKARGDIAQQTIQAALMAGGLALSPALGAIANEAAAFIKNPIGYCLANPSACLVSVETIAFTAAGVPQTNLSTLSPGKLTGSIETLNTSEQKFVAELIASGKNVELIPTSTARTADFFIDGVQYELKTLSGVAATTSDKLSGAIASRIMDARGQSGNIIIDARNQSGMTTDIAERGIFRALGNDERVGSKIQSVTVITHDGTVYIPGKTK